MKSCDIQATQRWRATTTVLVAVILLWRPAATFGQRAEDLFDQSILHELRFTMAAADWQSLKTNYLQNTYYNCDMDWRGPGGVTATVRNLAMRSRGTGSRNPIKPALRLNFARNVSTQEFLGLRNLVLDNNVQDSSMLKERLAMTLSRQMGILAPRVSHARVYVNGEYVGLYQVIEYVDATFLKQNFGDDTGFLYDYTWEKPWNFEYLGEDPALYIPVPFEPQTNERDPQPQPLIDFTRTANQAPDAESGVAISRYLDLKSFATYLAIDCYLAEWDGVAGEFGMNNFYLYRFTNSTLFQFITWDKDTTFGIPAPGTSRITHPVFARLAGNVLARRLLEVPLFRNAFLDALSRVSEFTGGPGGWLEREILTGVAMIQSAVVEDPYRLCFDGQGMSPCGPGDFENEVEAMLAFSRGRRAFVSGELPKLPLVATDTFAFGIHPRGAVRVITSNAASMTPGASGYAELTPGTGQDLGATGVVTSSWRDGVLVHEYAVPSAALIKSGHVFIEQGTDRSTEISIVNTSDQTATVTFTNTGTDGSWLSSRILSVAPHQQWSGSLNSDPNALGPFTPRDGGIFRFESNVPVAVTSRRSRRNEQFDVLTSSIAAIETETLPPNPVVLPQFAAGAGWSTEIVLLNAGTQTLEGTVAAFDPEGRRLKVAVRPGGELLQSIGYRIAAGGVWGVQIVSTEGSISGSVRVSSDTQAFVPIAEAHLLFRQNGVIGGLTGYTAPEPAFRHRIYMEWDPRAPGGAILSAAAIANRSNAPAEITIELNNASGAPAGRSRTLTIPPGGQRALFLWELIGSTTGLGSFEGTVRIESTQPVAVLGLRTRMNSRGDFLFAVTPAVAEVEKPLAGGKRVVGIENGADQESHMILVPAGEFTTSSLRLFLKDGQPLRAVLH